MANFFTEKAGPLPVWAWLGIVTVAILLFIGMRGKSSGNQNTTAQQQQLAAEEAALANAAGQNATAGYNSPGTYGSGWSMYNGNGYTGTTAGVLQTTPASSDTTTSTGTGTVSTTTAPPTMSYYEMSHLVGHGSFSIPGVITAGDTPAQGYAKIAGQVGPVQAYQIAYQGGAGGIQNKKQFQQVTGLAPTKANLAKGVH